jgi:hypothetical protein
MKLTFKRKIQFYLEIGMTLLTISSLAVSTYAWFSMQKTASITFWSMHVPDDSIQCVLKYYTGNYSTETSTYPGYKDVRVLSDPTKGNTITDYANQFVPIANNAFVEDGPLDIKNLQPGICHTFSFEFTAPAGESKTVALRLTGFSSPGSGKNRIVNTETGITLASAIDMYATEGAVLSDSNTANSAIGNTFITSYMSNGPVDKFVYYDATETQPSSYTLWNGTIAGGTTELVFFTLEFTNMPATFYSYASTDGTHNYFTRSTSGDSNCYKGLSFNISSLYVGA